jgi:bifunctional enzyme CysN/CysC
MTLQKDTIASDRELLSIVIAGHVDHGKSTVIGRLLADTGSLPEGKLEQVKESCIRNARPFEYAFLLDALKDEQAQGITIDTARSFFKTALRDYILIDAPGHIEFLKNMVTGASRAEAALLVIDAHEGIKENSRRHGYLLSMLGLTQIVVLVNKMDLVGYDLGVFDRIEKEYRAFLTDIGVRPMAFVPICAQKGENIAAQASWYNGPTLLQLIDSFKRELAKDATPLRFPVQDVYKFTESGDDRRVIAGTVETGTIRVGDAVVFYPSGNRSVVQSIEAFNKPAASSIGAGWATGLTLRDELYVKRGEVMCRVGDAPALVGSRLRVNMFWMGKAPFVKGKRYKLKIGTARVQAQLSSIINILDASELTSVTNKQQVDRHEVAECILETTKPVAFDRCSDNSSTGRFVLVDNFEIAGGGNILDVVTQSGSILDEHVMHREIGWDHGGLSAYDRQARFGHRAKFIVITGTPFDRCRAIGALLERRLFTEKYLTYYLGSSTLDKGLGADLIDEFELREERIMRLGELARVLTDSGHLFITALPDLEEDDIAILRQLNTPNEILVVSIGGRTLSDDSVVNVDKGAGDEDCIAIICDQLRRIAIIPDYSI